MPKYFLKIFASPTLAGQLDATVDVAGTVVTPPDVDGFADLTASGSLLSFLSPLAGPIDTFINAIGLGSAYDAFVDQLLTIFPSNRPRRPECGQASEHPDGRSASRLGKGVSSSAATCYTADPAKRRPHSSHAAD
jgi:hypothetical protein